MEKLKVNVLLALIILGASSCNVYKTVKHGALPSQSDYSHFAQRKIDNQSPAFHFRKTNKNCYLGSSIGLTNRSLNATNVSLDNFVNLHKTISFLIIRNDTILYEKYNSRYTDTTVVSSFSMVKPMISALIGIAISEGLIESVDNSITDYLSEYKNYPGFESITIKNLLQHTSGIRFTDSDLNLASDNAEYYWGSDLRKELTELNLKTAPNVEFHYSSANTQLLALIIERVTKLSISNYLENYYFVY